MIRIGKGVFISSPAIGCADELIQLCQQSVDFHRPWVHPPSNANEFSAYMDRIATGTTIGLFVRRVADNRLIGVVNLNEPVMGALRSAYLGFYADASYRESGRMTEGVGLVLDHAFEDLGFHRLEANVQPSNIRSLRFLTRLGFRKEGFSPRYLKIGEEWRDHERWAILAEEWHRMR
jgi:[ribosomal protein S5]-alanine N-acetyltransferase